MGDDHKICLRVYITILYLGVHTVYSHNSKKSQCFDILAIYSIRLLRSKKDHWPPLLLTSMNWRWMKKQSSVLFELDNIGKKKRGCSEVKNLIYILS